MPLIRPSSAVRAARTLETRAVQRTVAPTRSMSSTSRRAASHGSHYDEPTGWLFGVKPGEKYKPEGWENIFFWGFCGSFVVVACLLPFKPDTSIQTWALEEARRRLEAEGILEDPFPDKKQ